MARTYRNIVKVGICNGNNTEYYKHRRQKVRNKNKHMLRNLTANYDINDIADMVITIELPKRDDWDEPTDGTFLISNHSKREYLKSHGHSHDGTIENWWNRKYGKQLKNKHNKY